MLYNYVSCHIAVMLHEHDIRPSVCLTVTLVYCDHTVQQKVKNWHMTDRSVSWPLA